MQVAAIKMTRPVDQEIKRVTVTLPKHQLDALQAIAQQEDVSVAWLVRKAVDKLLRQGQPAPSTNYRSEGKARP
jgi:metal-responsive CopG/Arc/MetJ family transcriptional regulator